MSFCVGLIFPVLQPQCTTVHFDVATTINYHNELSYLRYNYVCINATMTGHNMPLNRNDTVAEINSFFKRMMQEYKYLWCII